MANSGRVHLVYPGEWPDIDKEIERMGLPSHHVAQYELERLDILRRRVQVRDTEHVAPKDQVALYIMQMPHNLFPPIIVTEDDYLIDGSTREEAWKKLGHKFYHAVVIEISWLTATPHQKRQLAILGATLNSRAGLGLTTTERRSHVRTMLVENYTAIEISRRLGVKVGVISHVKREIDAEERLRKVGIEIEPGMFKLTGLRALGMTNVLALNSLPYKELALLSNDAGLAFIEICTLAKEMRDSGSDEGALSVIANKRTEFAERITNKRLTGNGRPPAASLLRQRLGFITSFEGREHELVDRNPDNSEKHFDALKASIKVLKKVLELQV